MFYSTDLSPIQRARALWDWFPLLGLVGLDMRTEEPDVSGSPTIIIPTRYLCATIIPRGNLILPENLVEIWIPDVVTREMSTPDGTVFVLHAGQNNWPRLQREINSAALRVAAGMRG